MHTPLRLRRRTRKRLAEADGVYYSRPLRAAQAKEMLPLTQHEAYIGTIFGRMFFLPAMHCLRMRHLDRQKAEAVMREVRGTAWLLWRIHLAFRQMASRQGMGAYLALILIQKLPQVNRFFCLAWCGCIIHALA